MCIAVVGQIHGYCIFCASTATAVAPDVATAILFGKANVFCIGMATAIVPPWQLHCHDMANVVALAWQL